MAKHVFYLDRFIFEKLSLINKSVFNYVTQVTLAGLIRQIGETVENDTIILISKTLFFLVGTQLLYHTYMIMDFVSSYLHKKIPNIWVGLIFFIPVLALYIWLFVFHIQPAIDEVFEYYSRLADSR